MEKGLKTWVLNIDRMFSGVEDPSQMSVNGMSGFSDTQETETDFGDLN
jgi:hypothetical protein